jgi:deoxyhypusine synthase
MKYTRKNLLKRKVIDIVLSRTESIESLCTKFTQAGGFSAKKIPLAVDIFLDMYNTKNCIKFLSFPGSIVATGIRGILKTLVEKKLIDVLITTCATIDHDLARGWRNYYHGFFDADDTELQKIGINRLGNIFIPVENYGLILERKVQPILAKIYKSKKMISGRELIFQIGLNLKDTNSIIYWAARNRIPVYVPGITDGAFGSQVWLFRQKHRDFQIDVFADENELADIIFRATKTGALIIGGGISKHHTIWWNLFKGGLDFAISITTALEYDGSLSGARLKEAISWGKLHTKARYVTVDGDATIMLPLIVGCVLAKLERHTNF